MAKAFGATEQNSNLTMRAFVTAAAANLTLQCFFWGLESWQVGLGRVKRQPPANYPLSPVYEVPEHSIEMA